MIGVELVLVSAATSAGLGLLWIRRPGQLVAVNHRGDLVPVVLGLVVLASAAAGLTVVALERAARSDRVVTSGRVVAVCVAVALVFAAGLADDLSEGGARGLRGHIRSLRAGIVTTGIGKVAAGLIAGIIVAVAVPNQATAVRAAGVILMAAAANVWNGLDVAPGRAAKAFLLGGAGVLPAGPAWAVAVPLLALYGATIPAGWLDLRERGMLGDSGANAIGFALGAGLYTVLPGWGVAVAATGAVGLNVVAESVTFSRIIDHAPVLRWFDRLGRPKKSVPRD
jgi:hypothetical protein